MKRIVACLWAIASVSFCFGAGNSGVLAEGAKVEKLAGDFAFTEGPAADAEGNVYFTDQPNDRILLWSVDGKLSVWLEGTGRSNGLYFDHNGDLLACADLKNEMWSIDIKTKEHKVLFDNYQGKLLNGPNDLWVDPKGGIYFTDPFYKRTYWDRGPMEQDGQHVYYFKPDRKTLIRVADDLRQPNGIIGTPDGKLLYVADIGAGKTYVYKMNEDGTLSDKKLFAPEGSDGMTIDNEGNIYLTTNAVPVYSAAGEKIETIAVPERPANVTFGGGDGHTLFITAKTSLYGVKMRTHRADVAAAKKSLVAEGAKVEKLAGDFAFTEGPAADKEGNVYFSDIPNNKILKWSLDGKLSTFLENTNGGNGLMFDKDGNLIACCGGSGQLVSISPDGKMTVLAEKYWGKRLNSPNDLWIDPKGGIYFSDPRYGNREGMEQDGEHVYYLSPDRAKLIRVIDDMVRPNGLIGTPDGQKLYVADNGANETYVYTVNIDGTLTDKKLFCSHGSDGVTLDSEGNVYLTGKAVVIFSPEGKQIETIEVPEQPSNVTFGGADGKTLFITARTSLYSVKMEVGGSERRWR